MENVSDRGFKRKTMDKNIRKKMEDWLKSIDDEKLRDDMRSDIIVTGGAIASMCQGYLPNDYDVYFKNYDILKRVAEYYCNKLTVQSDKVSAYKLYPRYNDVYDRVEALKMYETNISPHGLEIYIKSAGIIRGEDDTLADYDYFESMPPQAAEAYMDALKDDEDTGKKEEKGKYRIGLITSNAITLSNGVQIVNRFIGSPEEIHDNYDFVHCTNWWTFNDGINLNMDALESIITKELKYVGSKYPLCSMFRLRKFIARGWSITAGEMFKIGWDIHELNLKDRNILQDQLTGVDAAYFAQLFRILNENKDHDISRTYIFELMNRVFDGEGIDVPHDVVE